METVDYVGIFLFLLFLCWGPIYGLIWLLAGWEYVILAIKIKAVIAAVLIVWHF
jgi:hypothetical protein